MGESPTSGLSRATSRAGQARDLANPSLMSDSPWLSIWAYPRATLRSLLSSESQQPPWTLAITVGMVLFFAMARQRIFSEHQSLESLIAFSLLAGPVLGGLTLGLAGWLFRRSGRWLGGRGTVSGVRLAVSWAALPFGSLVFVWIALIAHFGVELFRRETPFLSSHPEQAVYLRIAFWIALAMCGWTAILLANTLAEAHGLSLERAVGSILLGLLAVFGPLLALLFLWALVPMNSSPPREPYPQSQEMQVITPPQPSSSSDLPQAGSLPAQTK